MDGAIDRRIIQTVTGWYREHGKPPALCVLHPVLYRNKTIYDVRIPLIPTFQYTVAQVGDVIEPIKMDVAMVRLVEMDTQHQSVPPEQWIVCLSDMQVMQMLVDHPELMKG